MKLAKRSLYGLVISFCLILTSPTYVQGGNLSGSKVDNDASASDVDIVHEMLSAEFDGRNLSLRVVRDIAEDPLITFGTVRDANGKEIQGEVWLLVAKNDKFIYFHLTDQPNSAKDSTAYGGYTTKVKAITTTQFYYYGFGGAVPIIGNETDGFLVTTTKMMVNSAFTEGERQQRSFSTGDIIDYLVYVYDVVQSYSLPPASSAPRWAMIQHLAPDGTELVEPFALQTAPSSGASSSNDCEAVGDDAADYLSKFISGVQVAATFATIEAGLLRTTVQGMSTGLIGTRTGTALTFAALSAENAIFETAEYVGTAAISALAEGLCNGVSTPEVLPPIELDLYGVEDIEFAKVVYVCDRTETVGVGSSARDDGAGGIEVTGHSQEECAEGHFEVVEGQ